MPTPSATPNVTSATAAAPIAAGGRQRGRRRGTQPVQLGQDVRGLRLVAGAQIGVVGVGDVAGSVLELELPQRTQGCPLVLGQLLARIDGQRQERGGASP